MGQSIRRIMRNFSCHWRVFFAICSSNSHTQCGGAKSSVRGKKYLKPHSRLQPQHTSSHHQGANTYDITLNRYSAHMIRDDEGAGPSPISGLCEVSIQKDTLWFVSIRINIQLWGLMESMLLTWLHFSWQTKLGRPRETTLRQVHTRRSELCPGVFATRRKLFPSTAIKETVDVYCTDTSTWR